MASIVQSTMLLSAKASVSKTESLKQQRSVKSVARAPVATFASSEETSRRQAMSLFAVGDIFSLQRAQNAWEEYTLFRRLEKNRIRAEGRKSKPRDRADDPIRADSNGNGSFAPDGDLASKGFSLFSVLFSLARSDFYFFFLGPIENHPKKGDIVSNLFKRHREKSDGNLFVILRYTHRAPPL